MKRILYPFQQSVDAGINQRTPCLGVAYTSMATTVYAGISSSISFTSPSIMRFAENRTWFDVGHQIFVTSNHTLDEMHKTAHPVLMEPETSNENNLR